MTRRSIGSPPIPSKRKSSTPSSNRKRGRKSIESIPPNENEDVDRVLGSTHIVNSEDADTPMSRGYFQAKSKSSKKSSKKIADIHVVEEQDLREALTKLEPKHAAEQANLLNSYKSSYSKWHFQLKCGFGLLMYGFGSKRGLLEDFASTTLVDGAAVVVNGYLPNVNLKQVVYTIADAICQQSKHKCSSSQSLEELLAFLTSLDNEDSIVYLIVHSIDGPGLRDSAMQQSLAKLATCSAIYLVASTDNINAPLLWNKRSSNTQFNWWWHHTPTYAAYTLEAAFIPLVLATSGVNKSVRSAVLVLRSLTPNAQSVFKLLAQHQLANPDDEGLTQHQLYTKCREGFLVSSELTLRAHLTEFRDHQLVRTRRASDGQDCLYISLPPDAITKLLEDLTQTLNDV